jgi:hypothetical protein
MRTTVNVLLNATRYCEMQRHGLFCAPGSFDLEAHK